MTYKSTTFDDLQAS